MNRVRIGIAGFGTVGRATAEIISEHADLIAQRSGVRLDVTAVCRRPGVKTEDIPVGARVFTDWNQLVANSDVDVTVETIWRYRGGPATRAGQLKTGQARGHRK